MGCGQCNNGIVPVCVHPAKIGEEETQGRQRRGVDRLETREFLSYNSLTGNP